MPKMKNVLLTALLLVLGSALVLSAQTNGDPSVQVEDQKVRMNRVKIAQVVSDGQGWLVIHADRDGGPGPVIGYKKVKDGVNKNVRVKLDKEMVTDTLYAMLHTDSGEMGTYEFPDADPPVEVDGETVVEPFELTG